MSLEIGIPAAIFKQMTLNTTNTDSEIRIDENDSDSSQKNNEQTLSLNRDPEFEYRILTRLNCHKQ